MIRMTELDAAAIVEHVLDGFDDAGRERLVGDDFQPALRVPIRGSAKQPAKERKRHRVPWVRYYSSSLSLSLKPFDSVELPEITIKSAEGQMTSAPGDLEHQAIRERKTATTAENRQPRAYELEDDPSHFDRNCISRTASWHVVEWAERESTSCYRRRTWHKACAGPGMGSQFLRRSITTRTGSGALAPTVTRGAVVRNGPRHCAAKM